MIIDKQINVKAEDLMNCFAIYEIHPSVKKNRKNVKRRRSTKDVLYFPLFFSSVNLCVGPIQI